MSGNPQVFGLLEEMLDSGKTPEEVCRDCPELLTEVRQRWQEFQLIDAQVGALIPGLRTVRDAGAIAPVPSPTGLPQVPGYEVEAVLGHGGMGIVYKARQRALDRPVALKMLLAGPLAGPQELGRFRRETAALAGLRHPNIVQVYDAGDVEGRPYFTMEYVEGGSLAQKLAGTPQPARQAAELVATLAAAVEVAHQGGIVHRDLKPANVLLTADGTPKVTDFGLARRLEGGDGLTQTGVPMGTPSYMAPEQARGETRGIGPAVDVYALGAILYELLTGRPPFRAETPAETVQQVISQDPVPPARLNARVPRDLDTICSKCLQKDPGKRYVSAAQLAADLGRFLRHEPIHARPTGWVEHGLRWVRRRPAAAGLLAAVVLLVLAGGVGAGLLYQQWTAARARQAQTDREVRGVLEWARGPLEEAWQVQDLPTLTAALAEGNRAVDIARSGAASAAVQQEAEAFRTDADERLGRARKTRALLEAVLDVSEEASASTRGEAGRVKERARPSADEQYAAAFHGWGLDVDGTAEADVVARLGAEPDPVVQEVIAALDTWTLARRRRHRPEAEWRRLSRIADRLDHSERHHRLRALLVGESPPRAESVAAFVGTGLPWPALWELARGDNWQRLREARGDIDPRTDPVLTVALLARAYAVVGDAAGAEQILREAVTARPDQVVLLDALGTLLERQGPSRRGKAIECYRAARALRPRLGVALSGALLRAGRAEEAEDVLQDLRRQQLDTPQLYNYLGACLDAQKKHPAAEAAYRKAIDLQPDYADAHNNLGMCLDDQRKPAAAEASFRKAIDLRPDFAPAHSNLGNALTRRKNYAAAEASFRKAIDLQPDSADAYYNLGNVLAGRGQPGAAAAAYRKAIDLAPDFALAYNNLGMALSQQQKPAAAEAYFRKAIDLQADYAVAYHNLGTALGQQRKYAEAEAACRKAIDLQPGFAPAHFNLAEALMEQARFEEALAFMRMGNELLPARDPLRERTRQLLQRCERYMALEARLPAILRGAEKPANAAEQIEFAELCLLKQLDTAAARFYQDAFTAEPKLAEDVPAGARYNAACTAARAAEGRSKDADTLGDAERARWRRQALEWLRQDLTWWGKALPNRNAQARAQVGQWLQQWQADPDLAGVRARDALARLPDEDRKQWEQFWSDVEALLRRASVPE
jgi:serine/threonine-protein kinase